MNISYSRNAISYLLHIHSGPTEPCPSPSSAASTSGSETLIYCQKVHKMAYILEYILQFDIHIFLNALSLSVFNISTELSWFLLSRWRNCTNYHLQNYNYSFTLNYMIWILYNYIFYLYWKVNICSFHCLIKLEIILQNIQVHD